MEMMLDTHAVARALTEAEFTPAQADALTDAIASAAKHGNHITPDQLDVKVAELRAEIANLDTKLSTQIANLDTRLSAQIAKLDTKMSASETRLSWRMLGIAGLVVAALRLLN